MFYKIRGQRIFLKSIARKGYIKYNEHSRERSYSEVHRKSSYAPIFVIVFLWSSKFVYCTRFGHLITMQRYGMT